MAFRVAMLKSASENMGCMLGLRRWTHGVALPSPLDTGIDRTNASPPFVLPEFDRSSENNVFEFGFPSFSFGGSMELMAVPKRKVSPHKRGIRNGPKALKPIPVIIRCKVFFLIIALNLVLFLPLAFLLIHFVSCGRVKLPHFYCCSGNREHTSDRNDSN